MPMDHEEPDFSAIQDYLPDRADEPVVEPMALEQWADLDLPLRGQMRQRMASALANNVRERRTIDGLASRIAGQAVSPIAQEIERVASEELQDFLRNQAASMSGIQEDE